ncbi:carbohydrate esterase family 16 protein [Thermothielavioides terrestris NRRL 8126]|uniref:Carbohydrate esterase family 16 protein n=1 Tax=Thermothielavioides terrestris (strain ATCC 38088 / NRRL 8126) TaxID=578455 RepID=G2R600_THETT|nr:carbohydrate esterase family 16 protein [Thermothielavioides terrestris NRRL 8126]AEO68387.1 carbohydrate esterase family 16 protein [Thermothielavioides terrestris NRRL 8126]
MGLQYLKTTTAAVAILAAACGSMPGVQAADVASLWGQCGGIGYTGPTQCVSGAVCTHYNDWYYQCIPGATTSAVTTSSTSPVKLTTTSTPTTLSTSTSTTSSGSGPTSSSAPAAVKYLITFGDSYSQTGFDINSTKPAPGNPLGNPPLPGWTASGGLNWVGFLTSVFNTTTVLTYNFAYGGATTNATLVAPYEPTVLSLIDQVAEFSGSIASKPSYAPWTAQNSLFGVWIGVNDVGNSWWLSNYTQIVDQIMDSYFGRLQVLYDAGARNFVLLSVPPINRTPLMLAESTDSQQAEATAIAAYNAALTTRLAAFTSKNSGVTGKIVDTSVPFNTALDNPTAYGAPDNTCYNSDGTSCLWFNNYHPGIAINKLVAQAVADAWKGTFF